MKTLMFLGCVAFVGLVVGLIGATPAAAVEKFTVSMTGHQEVPMLMGESKGTVTFTVNYDKTEIAFKVEVTNIKDANGAHIHVGNVGKNGPPAVLPFTGPEKTGVFSGVLAEGKFTAKELVGPLAGKTIADVVAEMAKGTLYVNVHTKANPNGEIRGQIK